MSFTSGLLGGAFGGVTQEQPTTTNTLSGVTTLSGSTASLSALAQGSYYTQTFNTPINTSSTSFTSIAADQFIARLREDIEAMKEVMLIMRQRILKLEGEVIRLNSSSEGKDKAADEILRQMDCYLA